MGIAVAHIAGDLIILSGCVFQKKFRFFHPFSGQGFNKGFTRIIFKDRTEIAGAHGQMGADRIQGHICIFIMLLNIIQCPECLPFTVSCPSHPGNSLPDRNRKRSVLPLLPKDDCVHRPYSSVLFLLLRSLRHSMQPDPVHS